MPSRAACGEGSDIDDDSARREGDGGERSYEDDHTAAPASILEIMEESRPL
jgi:hypothetical protein